MKLLITILLLSSITPFTIFAEEVKSTEKKLTLDPKVLFEDDTKGIDSLFKNMIVVQKKAIERKNKFILLSNLSFDFSDNPKTIYSATVGAGYALSDSMEFSFSYSPYIIANERASVRAVRKLTLENGDTADLKAPDPKWQAGASLLWAFAYGKDAFGPYSIIRSDTFLKFSASKIQYAGGLSGNCLSLLVGKTFFVSKYFNFRFAAGFARQTSFINDISQATTIGLIEPGLVWFL
jgi:hypothetical protein